MSGIVPPPHSKTVVWHGNGCIDYGFDDQLGKFYMYFQ